MAVNLSTKSGSQPSDVAQGLISSIKRVPDLAIHGRVVAIVGLIAEVEGIDGLATIGDQLTLSTRKGHSLVGEVIGFRARRALVIPFGPLDGLGPGCAVHLTAADPAIYPSEHWQGRVINAFGGAIDGGGPLPPGSVACRLRNPPPAAHARQRVGGKIDVGVRAINAFLTVCRGQRMGIFAGSGVGKSTLLAMMARAASADVNVIGLIGERGREAREFIEDSLGEAGLARSVVIVATSDEPPPVRKQAAMTTLAVAEYFRDQGRDVLCMMDSVTRFAMAQREIGLAVGEPPTSKGYTPSCFAELPKLLERAGPGVEGAGNITGLFTVLVDGDDHNEPVADAVRGILDGHIVLDRRVAEQGRYPPINILKSVSRTMPGCNTADENDVVVRGRRHLAAYEDMAELIRLGAYRSGANADVDEAIRLQPALQGFLRQGKTESGPLAEVYGQLGAIVGTAQPTPAAPAAAPQRRGAR